ncbi:aromatic amino acid aminotransferase II [Scheffersomyces coipomensis]|uniref:aromatic amino acid aminotransferase II n=1 Tax=Scheffersomyces coipomensis TaxID=1788519 RepID=UPI00315CE096
MAPTSTTLNTSTSEASVSPYSIDHLISDRSKNRSFKHFAANADENAPKNFKPHPKPLALSFGRPNAQFFPVKKISVELDHYPFQDSIFEFETETAEQAEPVIIEKFPTDKNELGAGEAFQYGDVAGLPNFQKFLREFVETIHKPGNDQWGISASNGSGEGLNKVADAIINPGDIVLFEEFTFSPFGNNVRNVGGIPVPVKLNFKSTEDADIDIKYLSDLLDNWDEIYPEYSGRKPKAFYTIPTCQNPTGLTQSVETRQAVYDLASKHDFIIIEDDPYGYLTLPKFEKPNKSTLVKDHSLTVDEYLAHHLPKSYLQFDKEGRVIRVETFSKVFAPGLRLGFIVAHKKIIEVIKKYSSIVTRSPSGAAQLILLNIIQKKFGGINGWLEWILRMRLAYAHRRNVLIDSISSSEAYSKGYINVISADAGMFASLLVNFPSSIPSTEYVEKLNLLNYKFLEKGVTVVLGYKMSINQAFSEPNANFLRLSYAPLDTDEQLAEAGKRLGEAVEEFFENGFEF